MKTRVTLVGEREITLQTAILEGAFQEVTF